MSGQACFGHRGCKAKSGVARYSVRRLPERHASYGNLIVFTVHFKGFFHLFKDLRILTECVAHLYLVERLGLIADPVFHRRPEIHGDRTELDLNRVVFHTVHVIGRYAHDDMVTAVAVWLWSFYLIFFADQDQVSLLF